MAFLHVLEFVKILYEKSPTSADTSGTMKVPETDTRPEEWPLDRFLPAVLKQEEQ